MGYPVVTAIDRAYLPGLRALANSFRENAGNCDLYCIAHGDDDLRADIRAAGATPIDPPEWVDHYPTTEAWPTESPAMYARLLLPRLFPEGATWIDADCVVLKSLEPLSDMRFSEPVAAVRVDASTYSLGYQIRGYTKPDAALIGPFSGLLVFNSEEWNRRGLTERCAEVMREPYDFRYVVQSVLALAVKDGFHRLDSCWQVFANRKQPIPQDARILHWVGALPWRDAMPHADIWERYA